MSYGCFGGRGGGTRWLHQLYHGRVNYHGRDTFLRGQNSFDGEDNGRKLVPTMDTVVNRVPNHKSQVYSG
jgi:hypothetical protein